MRRYTLTVGERPYVVDVQMVGPDRYTVVVDAQHFDVALSGDEAEPTARIQPQRVAAGPGASEAVEVYPPPEPGVMPPARAVRQPRRRQGPEAASVLYAPMPGVVLTLMVQAGDLVQRGQPVAVLDAMKMHNTIGAPRDGCVEAVCVATGQAVAQGTPLMRLQAG